MPANSSTSPTPSGPSAWQRPGPHPQLVIHPTLNLRLLLLIDAVQHQAPPQPVTPPQDPPYSQSISPSSTSISVHRPALCPAPLHPGLSSSHAHSLSIGPISTQSLLMADPSLRLVLPLPSLRPALPKATPPSLPVSLTSSPSVRPHQADELRQAETNADPDTVSHLPRRPHRTIIAREKFLAELAFRLRAAGAWKRRALSEAVVSDHDLWLYNCPDLPGANDAPSTPSSSSTPGIIDPPRSSVCLLGEPPGQPVQGK